MKRIIWIAFLIIAGIFVCLWSYGVFDKYPLCPCGTVYKALQDQDFSSNATYEIKGKDSIFAVYYCWYCGTKLSFAGNSLADEPVNNPKPCACNSPLEFLYDPKSGFSYAGSNYIMETLHGKRFKVRYCWFCGGKMPEFNESEWSVIYVAPATKSLSGSLKEVVAELNELLEKCRSGTKLKPTTIILDDAVPDRHVDMICTHGTILHTLARLAKDSGADLRFENNTVTIYLNPNQDKSSD